MIKSIIKNGELYLEKRSWRNGYYLYFFTKNIYDAVILDEQIASIWLKDILTKNEIDNNGICISEIEITLNENTNKPGQYIMINHDINSFIKDVRYSPSLKEVFGFKYTDKIQDAKYLNELSLKRYLIYKEHDENIVVKKVIRKEIF